MDNTRVDEIFTVIVNGQAQATEHALLGDLVRELRDDADKIATAVNGEFVSIEARDSHTLNDGDQIDIVAPMAGG